MTTKVTVSNHGPDNVAVSTQSISGGMIVSSESRVVRIGEHHDFYVHTHQQLKIEEICALKSNREEGKG